MLQFSTCISQNWKDEIMLTRKRKLNSTSEFLKKTLKRENIIMNYTEYYNLVIL